MVLGVVKQNKGVEQQFQQLAARLVMAHSRISEIESQPSRHLLKETTEINKVNTDVHLRDPTVSSETGAEYLQTSVTGRTVVSTPTLPSRAPCLQPSKLQPSPAHYGPQGTQECRPPVAQTQPDKPKIPHLTFSSNTSWDDYLAQFELVTEKNRWDDSMKAIYLAVSLTGPAQTVLGDLQPKSRKNFAELKDAKIARLILRKKVDFARHQHDRNR